MCEILRNNIMTELLILSSNLAVRTVVTQVKMHPTTNYVILTDQLNIKKFLDFLDIPNSHIFLMKSSFKLQDIWGIYKQKRELKKFLDFDFVKLHFYHQAYGDLFNWIIPYCHKKGVKIEHHRVMPAMHYPWLKMKWKDVLLTFQYRFFYKTDMKLMNEAGLHSPYILPEFYRKNDVKEIELDIDEDVIKKCSLLIMEKLNVSNKADVVLLTGSVLSYKRVAEEEYNDKIKQIIMAVGKDRLVAKCHPRFDDESEVERTLTHIPSFIPMGFLLDFFTYFVGYTSTVLREAYLNGKTAVSLLEYLPAMDNDYKNYWYSYFQNINMLYPQTVGEIKEILDK